MSPPEPSSPATLRRVAWILAGVTAALAASRMLLEGPFSAVGTFLMVVAGAFALSGWAAFQTPSLAQKLVPSVGVVAVMGMALVEGGLDSEALYWLPFIPLTASLLVGARAGLGFAVVGSAGAGLLLLLDNGPFVPAALRTSGLIGATMFGGMLGWAHEREKQAALAAAQEVEHMKDALVTHASHELRTPLTAISGTVALLLRGGVMPLNPKGERLLQIADRNTRRLSLLVADLIDAQKMASGRLDLDLSPVHLPQFLRDREVLYRELCSERDAELLIDQQADLVVVADVVRLDQVLFHLIAETTRVGPVSTVTVTRRGPQVGIRVACLEEGAPQNHALVSRQAPTLNLARRIIEEMGGTLSPQDGGYEIALPMADADSGEQHAAQ